MQPGQKRRVFQGFAVAEQLGVGGLEVLVPALVLPAEMVAHPNVGPTTLQTPLSGFWWFTAADLEKKAVYHAQRMGVMSATIGRLKCAMSQ